MRAPYAGGWTSVFLNCVCVLALLLLLLPLLPLLQFYFPPGDKSVVEYRSASRIGESDGNINRYGVLQVHNH
jgi:hypothetical protein